MILLVKVDGQWHETTDPIQEGLEYIEVPYNTLGEYLKAEEVAKNNGLRCKCGTHKEKRFDMCFRCFKGKPVIRI